MNAGILRVLLRQSNWPALDSSARSLDAYANAFLEECEEFHDWAKEKPPDRELYEHKLVTVLRHTPPILSFRCDAEEDGGGAHPFGTILFANFESSTGRAVVLTDLLRESALAKLETVAEENFRHDNKLSPTESLSDNGYNFPGDRFRLNKNFGVGEKNLVFLFNTYEISAGAMDATEVTIPYVQIHDLVKPDLHLW
jgi:uncharacterized protein DUF3298